MSADQPAWQTPRTALHRAVRSIPVIRGLATSSPNAEHYVRDRDEQNELAEAAMHGDDSRDPNSNVIPRDGEYDLRGTVSSND